MGIKPISPGLIKPSPLMNTFPSTERPSKFWKLRISGPTEQLVPSTFASVPCGQGCTWAEAEKTLNTNTKDIQTRQEGLDIDFLQSWIVKLGYRRGVMLWSIYQGANLNN